MKRILDNKVIAFLKLVRTENLVMIVLTMFMLRYLVLQKILIQSQVELELGNALFGLLVLSTVLIAAAGYIINDYFDLKTDLINHPDTVVVDKVIKRRWAIVLHLTFTFAGIALGVYAALKTGYLRLAFFHLSAAALLWFYSTNLKKTLLVGNLVVSLLTAAVAFMPLVFEMGVMQKMYPGFISQNVAVLFSAFKVTFIFALFAFITSMAREIIKDVEDFKGDKATGGHTMPIIWGIRSSKVMTFFLLNTTALLMLFVVYNSIKASRTVLSIDNLYIILLLVAPLIALAFFVLKSNESEHFKKASLFLKLIMLLGLCYSFVFYYG